MPFNGVLSHLEEPLAEGLLGEAVVSSVTTPYGMLPPGLGRTTRSQHQAMQDWFPSIFPAYFLTFSMNLRQIP